jgi:hypothetical protein
MAVSLKEQLRLQRELGVTVKKRNRGGRRDGAGRKPIGDEPREKFGTRFSKEVMDFIDETSVGITNSSKKPRGCNELNSGHSKIPTTTARSRES